MTDRHTVGAANPAAPTGARRQAVRDLESAFSELMSEYRRSYSQAAESVSPGMLPGTFKVLSTIRRCGSITVSGIAERMTADKGHVSRAVSELEHLGLVERTGDVSDGRVKLITLTREGESRLEVAQSPYVGRLASVLEGWPVESIDQLTALLQALTRGQTPVDPA